MSILLLSYINKNNIKGDHQISEKMEESKIWVMLTLKNVQLQISTMADLTLEPERSKGFKSPHCVLAQAGFKQHLHLNPHFRASFHTP